MPIHFQSGVDILSAADDESSSAKPELGSMQYHVGVPPLASSLSAQRSNFWRRKIVTRLNASLERNELAFTDRWNQQTHVQAQVIGEVGARDISVSSRTTSAANS